MAKSTDELMHKLYILMDKKVIYNFIDSCPLMVISSLSEDGRPQSAVVGFGQTKQLQIIFGTSEHSRKAQNIVRNDAVAVVIGWQDKTIQLEGQARMLSRDEADQYAEQYFLKNPTARKYKSQPHERYFLVEPTWLRFTDTTATPWSVTELRF